MRDTSLKLDLIAAVWPAMSLDDVVSHVTLDALNTAESRIAELMSAGLGNQLSEPELSELLRLRSAVTRYTLVMGGAA